MKEETKHQLPSYGAILIAIIGAITTSIQYCNTIEETRRAEIAQKATNEVIIDGLSKEIAQVQKDMDALYRKAERVSIQQDLMQAQCHAEAKPKAKASWKDFSSFSGDSTLSVSETKAEVRPLIVRPQMRSAQDIKQDIYQSIDRKEGE